MSDSLVGRLEDEALKRKERLKALKRGEVKSLKEKNEESSMETDLDGKNRNNNEDDSERLFPKPIFRNYTPADDTLKPAVLPKPDLIELDNDIKDQLENAKPKPLIEKEIDLTTLAPQKVDWDLKRDLEKKLRVLEKRTQKAIAELIRDRLKEKNNLAELVSVGAEQQKNKANSQADSSSSESESDDEDSQAPTSIKITNINSSTGEDPEIDPNQSDQEEESADQPTTSGQISSNFLSGHISDDDDY
jgi:coiled-coil domain-containing protein 12